MAQSILLKRSSVAGNVPSSSDLSLGEIAINTADGAVYIKKGNNDIVAVHDNDILHIDTSNSRVGIGTTNPQTSLHVEGITRITESSNTAFYGGDYVRVFGNQYYRFRNTGGSTIAQIHMSGNSYFNGGNVGIGVTDPATRLEVKHDANASTGITVENTSTGTGARAMVEFKSDASQLNVYATGSNYNGVASWSDAGVLSTSSTTTGGLILNTQSGGIKFQYGTTERMRVHTNGNIGINETTPLSKFEVAGSIKATNRDSAHTSEAGVTLSYDTSNSIGLLETWTSKPLLTRTYNYQAFDISGTEMMRINATGVGIGTNNPQDRLHVTLDSATTNAEVEVMRVEATSTGTPVDGFGPFIDFRGDRQAGNPDSYGRIGFESDGMTPTTVDGAFIIQPAEDGSYTERMRVSSDGKVGIGTTSPDTKLDITAAGVDGLIMNQDTGNSSASGRIFFKSTERTNTILNVSGNLEFRTGANIGSSSGTVRMTIVGSTGAVKFNNAYTFPTSDGSANQVLATDGSGALSFVNAASGGGVSISNNANNRVLTGDGTNANAEANLTFDGSTLGVTGGITSSNQIRSTHTGASPSLWGSTTDAYMQVGPNGGGASGVFGAHRETTSSGLDYTTYIGYDVYYDDGNQKWYANRTNLGRKWKVNFGGYHQDTFKIQRYDGGGTSGSSLTAGWLEADWGDLFTLNNNGNATFAGTISSGVTTITSSGTIGGSTVANGYLKITDGSITMGIDPNEIHTTDNLYLLAEGGEIWFRDTGNNGVVLKNGQTQFMDSSRNLSNIGTISSGAITSSGNIDVNSDAGQLQFGADNDMQIFHNGANGEINISTGSFTIDSPETITLNADQSGRVLLSDGTTNYGRFQKGGTSWNFHQLVADHSFRFLGNVSGTETELLKLDSANSGAATFNSAVIVPSTYSQNFYVTSSGTTVTNRIDNDGTYMYISYGGLSNRAIQVHNTTGDVRLNYGASTKLTTFGSGVDITGELQSDSLDVDGNADISGNLVLGGNLTVNGTTTTLSTATLDVEDKNITLNKGSGDTSASADGAGITIQDAVDASNDATILWDATNDEFDLSHSLKVAGSVGVTNIVTNKVVKFNGSILDDSNITDTGSLVTLGSSSQVSGNLTVTGSIIAGSTSGAHTQLLNSGSIELCRTAGSADPFIDFKDSASDDYDVRLQMDDNKFIIKTGGAGSVVTAATFDATGNLGIGTTSPSHKLDVEGGNNVFDIARFGSSASDNSEITIGYFDANATNGIPGLISSSDFGGLIQGGENGHLVLGIRDNDASDALDIVSGGGNFMSDSTYDTLVATFKATGNVGIGTDGPSSKLHIEDAITGDASQLRITNGAGATLRMGITGSGANEAAHIKTNSGESLEFHIGQAADATTPRVIFDSSGNVGIGTTNPSGKLHVYDSGTDTYGTQPIAIFDYYDTDDSVLRYSARIGDGATTFKTFVTSSATDFLIQDQDNQAGRLAFQVTGNAGSNQILAAESTGKVGIGTITPNCALHVNGQQLRISNGGPILTLQDTTDDDDHTIRFQDNGGTTRFSITSAGDNFNFITNGTREITFQPNDTEAVRITSAGKVGVGTTSPQSTFQVEEYGIDTTSTSSSATTQIAIHTFAAATFRSARFTVQVTNSTDSTYHTTELLLVHDGTTANITEFGEIHTGSAVEATFDCDVNSGNVRLLATPASTDTMAFKVVCHSITT